MKKVKSAKCVSKVAAIVSAAGMISVCAAPVSAANASSYDYYAKLLKKNAHVAATSIGDAYTAACAAMSDPSAAQVQSGAVSGKLTVIPGDDIAKQFAMKPGTTFNVTGRAEIASGEIAINGKLDVSGHKIVDAALYGVDESLYVGFPELSSAWLTADSEDLTALLDEYLQNGADNNGMGLDVAAPGFGDSVKFFDGKVMNAKKLDTIFQRYTDIYLGYAKDVVVEKNVEVKTGDLKANYTKATVDLDGKEIYSLFADCLKAAKTDKEIIGIWTSLGMTQDDYAELLGDFSKEFAGAKSAFQGMNMRIEFYFDSTGAIVGSHVVSAVEVENVLDKTETYFMTVTQGNKTNVDLTISTNLFDLDCKGSTTINEAGKINSKTTAKIDTKSYSESGEVMINTVKSSFTMSNVDALKMSQGDFVGAAKLSVDSEDFKLKANLKGTGNKINVQANAFDGNNKKIVTVKCTLKEEAPKGITAPTGDTYRIVDEQEVAAYMGTLDMQKLAKNIKSAEGNLGSLLTDFLISYVTAQGEAPVEG